MREMRDMMGMPITVEVVDGGADSIRAVFDYLKEIDERFSTYKDTSEISRINRGEIPEAEWSDEMREVFRFAENTKRETGGYFDIKRADATIDPSGIVKGLAIRRAGLLLKQMECKNFFIEAGGDIESNGKNAEGQEWSVGIRNPFNTSEIVKVIYPKGDGVATSGSYERGNHIYDPHDPSRKLDEVVSITVIGPDALEADRFATAAFAMGRDGIRFIENISGLEAYSIDSSGTATMTSGFERFTSV